MATTHYRLLFPQRRILPVAIALGLGGALVPGSGGLRLGCALFAVIAAGAWAWLARARPTLVVDDTGYAVMEHGREKLRVAWDEVRAIRADEEEHALYVDVGDPARNLLVPPRGYGFAFQRPAELYQQIVAARPDAVERVARLDPGGAPAKEKT